MMIRVLLLLLALAGAAFAQSSESGTPPASNTYAPTSGSPINFLTRVGAACQGTGIYTTPSIGPAPSAGTEFVCVDLADNTGGNYSTNFYVVRNAGRRYTAAHTGIAVCNGPGIGSGFDSYGGQGGNCWGGQFQALCNTPGSICQGANIEADIGAPGAVNFPLMLVVGSSSVYCNSNSCPSNSFIKIQTTGAHTGAWSVIELAGGPGRNLLQPQGWIIAGSPGDVIPAGAFDFNSYPCSVAYMRATSFAIDCAGNANFASYKAGGSPGLTVTKTVRNAADTGTCTLEFKAGLLVGGTC